MKIALLIFISCLACARMPAQSTQIDRAMKQYDQLVLQGSYDSIANMFTLNAELQGENQASILGRDSIRKLLKSFQGASVLKYETTPQAISFGADTAVQSGSYFQIVRIHSGDTLELAGQYTATWIKENGQQWMIKKMYTHHYRNLKEENWINTLPDNSIAKQFGEKMLSEGVHAASAILARLIKDSANYYLKENEFNHLGYNLMNKDKNEEALEIFKTCTQLFPTSWNAFDSYGEALLKYGQKEEAVKMYKKSIELNPNNGNGKQVLQKITDGN